MNFIIIIELLWPIPVKIIYCLWNDNWLQMSGGEGLVIIQTLE